MAGNINGVPLPVGATASYLDYLQDASNDPYRDLPGGYTAIMDVFNLELNNQVVITPAAVQSLVLSAQGAMPMLLLHGGLIHTYLQPSLFRRRIGMPVTQWDDQMFVTKGDLTHNQAVTANWPSEYFHQVQQQHRVPTVATIQTSFVADPALQQLGPYGNNDAGTELVRVRRTCFCPSTYASLLLSEPVTPREAFGRIHTQLVIEGKEAECRPLVKFLQMAILQTANGGPSPLQLADAPTAPLADNHLVRHRNLVLFRDFPMLDQNLPRVQQNAIATRLGELVEDSRVNRAEERVRRDAERNKLPMDLLGATGVATLCRYTRVPDQAMLPPIFARLATATRHNRLPELQWAIDAEKNRLGYTRLHFTAVPALLQLVVSVRWAMSHHDSLSSGLQPYIFGDTTPEEAQEMSNFYQLVTAGDAAPNLEDAAQLMTPKKPNLPKHLFQSREMLQRLQIMFCILLGVDHSFTQNLTQFLRDFVDRESTLFWYKPVSPGYTLCMPILVIQWITLRVDWWFKSQGISDVAVAAPNLGELFTNIELGAHWEPVLSSSVLAEYVAIAPPPRYSPAVNPPGGQPGGGDAAQTGEQSGQSGLPNRMVTNEDYKEEIFGVYKAMGLNHSRLRNRCTVRPPASSHSSTGGEMCLSYNIKGICNMRCGKAYDHRPHTSDDNQKLLAWCQTHYSE